MATATVWVIDVDLWSPVPLDVLPREEQQRADSIRDPKSRSRWRTGRVLLRSILGSIVEAEPKSLNLRATEIGQPYLADNTLSFSMSRSLQWLMIGTSQGCIGVDIETRRLPSHQNAQALMLSPAEAVEISLAPSAVRLHRLRRTWARKEALLKALGLGLHVNPRTVWVGTDDAAMRCVHFYDRNWQIFDLSMFASVALEQVRPIGRVGVAELCATAVLQRRNGGPAEHQRGGAQWSASVPGGCAYRFHTDATQSFELSAMASEARKVSKKLWQIWRKSGDNKYFGETL
jgi:4'-phosphopantetheinyl transferase